MKKQNKHTIRGLGAHVSNPDAAALAKAINAGGDAKILVREAIIDAQIHHDWAGVAAIENSLTNVRNRTVARRSQNFGVRAVVVSRTDTGALAKLIPDGFEYGLAWLITMTFVRTDRDYWAGISVANEFHRLLAKREGGGGELYWGERAMCVPSFCFGPPSRYLITTEVANGNTSFLKAVQERGEVMFEAQELNTVGDIGATPLAYLLWGCKVVGTNTLDDLFNESVWLGDEELDRLNHEYIPLLAKASQTIGGDTFIAPGIASAAKAFDDSHWMSREHTLDPIIRVALLDETEGAWARVSLLESGSLPYLDQLLVSVFNRADMLVQTFRFPRTGNEMEDDAETIAKIMREHGIARVERTDPTVRRGANEVAHLTVDHDGQWCDVDDMYLGKAARVIRQAEWERGTHPPRGAEELPSVHYILRSGVEAILQGHYTSTTWGYIADRLSSPGDPIEKIVDAIRAAWAEGNPATLEWLLDKRKNMMLPARERALAVQFALSHAAVVSATDGLLEILDRTDLGDDCPVSFLQPPFDLTYFVTKTPAMALDEPNDTEGRVLIDGMFVQRWIEGETHHLLIDAFLTAPSHGHPYPLEVIPFKLSWVASDTLAHLREQIEEDDGLGRQVLDTYAGMALYMNSRDARKIERRDHSQAVESLAKKGRKKRKPEDYAAVNGSVDCIQVGPLEVSPQPFEHDATQTQRTGKRAHYRRGFVRFNQRVGKGRQQTRPVFVSPVLVNANKLADGLPEKKTYVIKDAG